MQQSIYMKYLLKMINVPVNKLEESWKAIIIRPTISTDINRIKRDKNKLKEIYQNGDY